VAADEATPAPDDDEVVAAVDAVAPIFAASGLDELEVEVGDIRVRLARPADPTSAPAVTPAGAVEAAPTSGLSGPEPAPGHRFVTAPLTGIWYTAPSPGARPYVVIGTEIAAGQVVGLIEAMKLFNEIKSDAGGTVTRFLAESGSLVKRQQPLLEIAPG
jgi:acetyl-CoA carboxylase biotin carboxyl carrier protein